MQYLVLKGGRETVVEHFLMENWGNAARHWWDNPHPVGRTASTASVLVLHVLDKGLGGRVVIHNGHLVTLLEGEESRANNCGLVLHRRRQPKFYICSCLTRICLTPMVLQNYSFGGDTVWLSTLVFPRNNAIFQG